MLLSGALILTLIVLGGMAFLPASAETITGSVHFDPDRIDLDLGAPSVVKAEIRFTTNLSKTATVKDINASTILLEGSLPPNTTYLIPGALVAEFDGEYVVSIIWRIIYHTGFPPAPYKIYLTITGNLNDTSGGTPFSVTGTIKLVIPHSPPTP